MKLETAVKILEKDAKFLGMNFLGYVRFVQANPLAQPQRTMEAYQVFTAQASRALS